MGLPMGQTRQIRQHVGQTLRKPYLWNHWMDSTGEFQVLQLIVFAAFGAMDQRLTSCMLVHFSEI